MRAFTRVPCPALGKQCKLSYCIRQNINKSNKENYQVRTCNTYPVHGSSCYWFANFMGPDFRQKYSLRHEITVQDLGTFWYTGSYSDVTVC